MLAAQKIKIEVYGADIQCASCVNAPSSKDTYEWLQAAIERKYPKHPFEITYIDIEKELTNTRQKQIAQQILNDEYFYPLVLIEEEVIGEGHIQLKPIFQTLERYGFKA